MIHPVILFYALLCALTLWLAARSPARDRVDAVLAASILTAGCLFSNVAWLTEAIGSWKRIDAAVMLLLLWILWRTLRPWKIVLASLAVLTMGVHALADWLIDPGRPFVYAYPATLNALFVLQLLTVASNGAKGLRENGSNRVVSSGLRSLGDNSDGGG